MNSFRIDSCRNCGTGLHAIRHCRDCEQPLVFECYNCHAFVDDPIHQHENLSQSLFSISEGLVINRDMSASNTGVQTV